MTSESPSKLTPVSPKYKQTILTHLAKQPTHFGFIPSPSLQEKIHLAIHQVDGLTNDKLSQQHNLYPLRDDIVRQVSEEMLEVMLGQLVKQLPENERKKTLSSINNRVQSTSTMVIDKVLHPTTDDNVLPTFYFLQDSTLFTDTNGKMRLGFKLPESLAVDLRDSFTRVLDGHGEAAKSDLNDSFNGLCQASLDHFLQRFTDTINLGFLTKAVVPVANSAVKKGIKIATGRLLYQLDQVALERLVSHYAESLFSTQPPLLKK